MAKRGRKVTPVLLAESQALVRALEAQVAVLQAWHPSSMPLSIIAQQLSALAGELAASAIVDRFTVGTAESPIE